MLTQAELKRIWHYDPDTGLFTRLIATAGHKKIGEIANGRSNKNYVQIQIAEKTYKAHRLAWLYMTGDWPKHQVDHINGIRDDNRWCNLRDVKQSVNQQNQRSPHRDNKSGYAGVCWDKSINKWRAQITVNNKKIHLGIFDDVHEAGAYRLRNKRELHPGCTI